MYLMRCLSGLLVVCGMTLAVVADEASSPAAADPPANQTRSAAEVVDEMMRRMQPSTGDAAVEPTETPVRPPEVSPVAPRATVTTDPRIMGHAPGMRPVAPRREGEFVSNRRGRLVRAADNSAFLFVFDADGPHTMDPPMILVPCRTLQEMEQLVLERGDQLSFTLSGQVLTYRGINHLLPTMMRPTIDRGNLGY